MTTVVIVYFPDGSRDFRYPTRALERGDVVGSNGDRYRVVDVMTDGDQQSVRVELDSDDLTDLLRSERGAIELEAV